MRKRLVKILVIDDSAVIRQIVSRELSRDPEIALVSTAMDPIVGEQKIRHDKPDAILLDIQMPRMNGLSFLRSLKRKSSIPVVIFSAYSEEGSENALKALELGAVAVVTKPNGDGIFETIEELATVLKGAIRVQNSQKKFGVSSWHDGHSENAHFMTSDVIQRTNAATTDSRMIAIGASTGGTEAIREILMGMPPTCPPIVVVIHMPKGFTHRFAARLNGLCAINVKEAENGKQLKPGLALIAPGDQHLVLKKRKTGYVAVLQNGPPVKRHKPSVEVLFRSVAAAARHHSLGIILTGMGSDGAEGLYEMRRMGAYTIAQNEETCIVFGMPKEAIKIGAVDCVLGLDQIPEHCIAWMTDSLKRMRMME